jgi:3-oxoacyl-[acyl-carrier-protein] synthase II
MQLKRVVIAGLGAMTPLSKTVEKFWKGLINRVSGADQITRFDASKFRIKFGYETKNYEPVTYFGRKVLTKLDLFTQFAIIATDEAIKDVNFDLTAAYFDRVEVILAYGIGGIEVFLKEVKGYALGDRTPGFSPLFIPMMISHISDGYISMNCGYRGHNTSTTFKKISE